MKKSTKKILALFAAAAVSTACLCTAVSAEEYIAPATYNAAEEEYPESEESADTILATYSNGASYVALTTETDCYFHIVLVDGRKIRANGTYIIQGDAFRANCTSYLIVNDDGSTQSGGGAIGVDGTFNSRKTTLTISNIVYRKD